MDAELPMELRGIAEELEAGSGFWRSCSGCHESNEGHPTGPYSEVFRCHLGVGCSECGGLGAVWDDTDYDALADFMAKGDAGVSVDRWPAGLLDRIKAAEQRVQDNRAPRSIPANPHSDVDLVLAEVRYLIEGRWPPFWLKDAAGVPGEVPRG